MFHDKNLKSEIQVEAPAAPGWQRTVFEPLTVAIIIVRIRVNIWSVLIDDKRVPADH